MSAQQQRASEPGKIWWTWLAGPDMYIGKIQHADGADPTEAAGAGAPLPSLGPMGTLEARSVI